MELFAILSRGKRAKYSLLIAGQFYGVICSSEHGRLHFSSSSCELQGLQSCTMQGQLGPYLTRGLKSPFHCRLSWPVKVPSWGRNGVNALANQSFLRTNLMWIYGVHKSGICKSSIVSRYPLCCCLLKPSMRCLPSGAGLLSPAGPSLTFILGKTTSPIPKSLLSLVYQARPQIWLGR